MIIFENKNLYLIACPASKPEGRRCSLEYQAVLNKAAIGQVNDNTIAKENHLLRPQKPIIVSSFNHETITHSYYSFILQCNHTEFKRWVK